MNDVCYNGKERYELRFKRWGLKLIACTILLLLPLHAAYAAKLNKKVKIAIAAAVVLPPLLKAIKGGKPKVDAPKVDVPGAAQPTDKKAAQKAAQEAEKAAADGFEKVRMMAIEGDIQAQYIMGCAYYTGLHVKKDDAAAVAWWTKAANEGHPEAAAYLGRAYEDGLADLPKQQTEANLRYESAYMDGSALAPLWLGMQQCRVAKTEDRSAGVAYLAEAAKRGSVKAKELLQEIEREGLKNSRGIAKEIDWRKEAVKTPLAALCTEAGANAFRGHIVAASHEEAAIWWELGAAQGDAKAQALLGTAYYTGRGVGQDFKKAVELLKTAAQHNDPLAQYALGKAYLAGEAVQKNKTLAVQLFRAAGDAGLKEAATAAAALRGSAGKEEFDAPV